MVAPLDSPQPVFTLPPIDQIPDEIDDTPEPGEPLGAVGSHSISNLVFGAGSFSNQYNSDDHLASPTPLRTIRLALRYGIRAFDTSAYYGPSEIVLGTALKAIKSEFPRDSYQLMTKCGRYGAAKANFDYSPVTIRASVKRSLSRLDTDYLDTVYLHDVEFVCTAVTPSPTGKRGVALEGREAAYGLVEGDEAKIWGEGDKVILEAVAELRRLKEEGLVRNIGITGYPLPTLLRLALLVLHHPPYKPLDIILSYSHLNLQNSTFAAYASHFYERAQVKQLVAASPLNMGLLTPSPPTWHPAPKELRDAVTDAGKEAALWSGGLPNISLGYAMRESEALGIPLAVGYSSMREVHESVRVWRELQAGAEEEKRKTVEEGIRKAFERSGFLDWSWASS